MGINGVAKHGLTGEKGTVPVEMGERVFLSLPRNGVPVANHLGVSLPFSREHGFSGGLSLPVFQAEEGDSLRVSLVGSENHISLVVFVTKEHVHVRSGGSNLPNHISARNVLPCSDQQDPGFIGAGVPAQANDGDEPKYWDPYLGKTDLVGTEHCASDPIEGLDEGVNGGRSLGSLKGTIALAIAASSEAGVRTESASNAGFSGMLKAGSEPRGPDPVVGMGKGVKGGRWFGSHVCDKTPTPGTSRLDSVAIGLSIAIAGYDSVGCPVRHGGQIPDLQSGSGEVLLSGLCSEELSSGLV